MKKVLVIGAGGTIGKLTIKYLLSEGKYEITALDLKNKKTYKTLNGYRKRVNVIYGDVLDRVLIEALIKDHDYVINLATVLPPMAEFRKDLVSIIEEEGTENIVRAINYYNPKCYLIYVSTTSVYRNENASVKDKITDKGSSYFANSKLASEKYIAKKTKNYIILRFSLILSDLRNDTFIYNLNKNDNIELITKEDAAYSLVKCLDNIEKVNKKVLNIGGGSTCQIKYSELIKKIMKYHGLSLNYLFSLIFVPKNYKSPILLDSDNSNNILGYQSDSLDSYFFRQKRRSNKRKLSKFLGKIVIFFLNKSKKQNK